MAEELPLTFKTVIEADMARAVAPSTNRHNRRFLTERSSVYTSGVQFIIYGAMSASSTAGVDYPSPLFHMPHAQTLDQPNAGQQG